jgi:hypothetical protein
MPTMRGRVRSTIGRLLTPGMAWHGTGGSNPATGPARDLRREAGTARELGLPVTVHAA